MSTPLSNFKITGTRIDRLTSYGLTEIVIPDGISEIKEYAFQDTVYNNRIQRIHIPDSVTRIGAFSMRDCPALTEVRLTNNLTRLERWTLAHCPQLSHLTLPQMLTYIGDYALCGCGLVSVVIPKNVIEIGTAAFQSCAKLTSAVILDNVKTIGDCAFYKCNQLTIYTVPGSAAEDYAKKNGISYKYIEDVSASTKKGPGTDEPAQTSPDKGYTSIQLRDTGDGFEICQTHYVETEGISNFYIDYEDGRIFIDWQDGSPQKTIGYYEQVADPVYLAKVFDASKQRVIGRVGSELIYFRSREADPASGRYSPDEECLAYYTKNGSITALGALLYMGFFHGSELGGAAAFVAVFNAYNFKGVYRDYFEMDPDSFKEKHHKYLHPMGW